MMRDFLRNAREAHGAVSRGLLEAFAATLPTEIKLDLLTVSRSSQFEFS